MTRTHRTCVSWRRRLGLMAMATAIGVLVLGSAASADPTVVTTPVIPGAASLPGPLVDPGKPATTMKLMTTKPDVVKVGASVAFSATGLPANSEVNLVWMTSNIRWMLDPKPDSVDYLGRKVDKIGVVARRRRQTDASRRVLDRPSRRPSTSAGCTTSTPSSTAPRLQRVAF